MIKHITTKQKFIQDIEELAAQNKSLTHLFELHTDQCCKKLTRFYRKLIDSNTNSYIIDYINNHNILIYLDNIGVNDLSLGVNIRFDNPILVFSIYSMLKESDIVDGFEFELIYMEKVDYQCEFNSFIQNTSNYILQTEVHENKIKSHAIEQAKKFNINNITRDIASSTEEIYAKLLNLDTQYKINKGKKLVYNFEKIADYHFYNIKCPICGSLLKIENGNIDNVISKKGRTKYKFEIMCNHTQELEDKDPYQLDISKYKDDLKSYQLDAEDFILYNYLLLIN